MFRPLFIMLNTSHSHAKVKHWMQYQIDLFQNEK